MSSDEESEREEAAEDEADEARARARLRQMNDFLRRMEQRTRRRRRRDARWLRGNINDRFANTKPSTLHHAAAGGAAEADLPTLI